MAFIGVVDTDTITLTAAGTIGIHERVKMSGTDVVQAGDEACIGYAQRSVVSGEECPVRLNSAPTHQAIAASAVTAGAGLFAAASGKVDDTGTNAAGTALTAASADGDLIVIINAQ